MRCPRCGSASGGTQSCWRCSCILSAPFLQGWRLRCASLLRELPCPAPAALARAPASPGCPSAHSRQRHEHHQQLLAKHASPLLLTEELRGACSRTNVPVVLAARPGCDTGAGAEGSALVRSWCAETGRHRRTHPKTSAIGMRSSPLCTAQTVPLRVGYVEEYSSLMQRAIRERKSQPKDFIEPED